MGLLIAYACIGLATAFWVETKYRRKEPPEHSAFAVYMAASVVAVGIVVLWPLLVTALITRR